MPCVDPLPIATAVVERVDDAVANKKPRVRAPSSVCVCLREASHTSYVDSRTPRGGRATAEGIFDAEGKLMHDDKGKPLVTHLTQSHASIRYRQDGKMVTHVGLALSDM